MSGRERLRRGWLRFGKVGRKPNKDGKNRLCSEKNRCRGKEQIISRDGAPVTVMVVPTNEELMIAQDTMELVLDQE